MRRFKSNLTTFLLANFLACWGHCQMSEGFKLISNGISTEVSGYHSDCADDRSGHLCKSCQTCEWVHSGGIYVPNFSLDLDHVFAGWTWDYDIAFKNSLSREVSLGILTAAPPHLISSRHFAFRTALPARSPSVLS